MTADHLTWAEWVTAERLRATTTRQVREMTRLPRRDARAVAAIVRATRITTEETRA